MKTWEGPNQEKKHEVEETGWAGRNHEGAKHQPKDGNEWQEAGGKVTISPPAHVKTQAIEEIQAPTYGWDAPVPVQGLPYTCYDSQLKCHSGNERNGSGGSGSGSRSSAGPDIKWQVRAMGYFCKTSWCRHCWPIYGKPALMVRLKKMNWRRVRQIMVSVDRDRFQSGEDCYEELGDKRAISNFIRDLIRTVGVPIVNWVWSIQWHRDGFPHWHIFVEVSQEGRAGQIGERILKDYWKYGLYVREDYIRDIGHWNKILGYFDKYGYFDDGGSYQGRLPKWALERKYKKIRRWGGMRINSKENSGKDVNFENHSRFDEPIGVIEDLGKDGNSFTGSSVHANSLGEDFDGLRTHLEDKKRSLGCEGDSVCQFRVTERSVDDNPSWFEDWKGIQDTKVCWNHYRYERTLREKEQLRQGFIDLSYTVSEMCEIEDGHKDDGEFLSYELILSRCGKKTVLVIEDCSERWIKGLDDVYTGGILLGDLGWGVNAFKKFDVSWDRLKSEFGGRWRSVKGKGLVMGLDETDGLNFLRVLRSLVDESGEVRPREARHEARAGGPNPLVKSGTHLARGTDFQTDGCP